LWPGAHISSLPILGNTGIITNSVVILFICDLDELLNSILMVISPCWVKHMSNVAGHEYESDSDCIQAIHVRVNAKLEGEVASLEEEVQMLSQNIKLLLEHSPDFTRLLAATKTDEDEDKFICFITSESKPGRVERSVGGKGGLT